MASLQLHLQGSSWRGFVQLHWGGVSQLRKTWQVQFIKDLDVDVTQCVLVGGIEYHDVRQVVGQLLDDCATAVNAKRVQSSRYAGAELAQTDDNKLALLPVEERAVPSL